MSIFDTPKCQCTCPSEEIHLVKYIKSLEAQLALAREALTKCIEWIEPVMDGFKIPKDAESRKVVLKFAQQTLAKLSETR